LERIKTKEELEAWFKENQHELLCLDTETTSLKYKELELESIQLYNGANACFIEPHLISEMQRFINGTKILIGHNLVFDLKVLHKYGVSCEHCEFFDTMVAEHLLDENNREIGLKDLMKKHFGKEVTSWKEARSKGIDSKEWLDYCINDVLWTWELMLKQKPQLEEQKLTSLFRTIEMPFLLCLLDMEVNGFLIDKEKVEVTTKKLHQEKENLEVQMLEELGKDYDIQMKLDGSSIITSGVNFNSSQQLSEIIFKEIGLPVVETTPGGNPSVGKLTISKYLDNPFIKLLNKYKICTKLLSGFFNPMPDYIDSDGRIRPSFNDCGTVTGRLSCSKPNLQQLPSKNEHFPISTRECFISPLGKEIVTCDYSGQELRVMAEISQDPTLIKAINDGKDLHLATANTMFDLQIPEEDLYKRSDKYATTKEKYDRERHNAKSIVFGLCYGKGAYGFSKDFGIPEDEAQRMVDKFFATYPRLKEAIDATHDRLRLTGFAQTKVGRKRRFKKEKREDYECYPSHAYRQSFNFLIQSLSADMVRKALTLVRNEAKLHPEWEVKLLATVHDEGVWECNSKHIPEFSKCLVENFKNAMKLSVELKAEVGVGKNYETAK